MPADVGSERRRGRTPRAGVRADARLDLRMTQQEIQSLQRLFVGQPLVDACRLALLDLAASVDEDSGTCPWCGLNSGGKKSTRARE